MSSPTRGVALPAEGGSSSLADGEWHRLHPLTPLFRGGLALVIIAGIVISNMRDRLTQWVVALFTPEGARVDLSGEGDLIDWITTNELILLILAIVAGVVLLLIAAFWLVWRFQQFRITGEHVEVRKGIVFRSHRRAPLDRVQGVNLIRPFPARLAGMAKLEVVGAGTDANVPLEYLSTKRAERVRADILRLASGARAARRGGAERTAAGLGRDGSPVPLAARVGGVVGEGLTGLVEGVDHEDVVPESVVKIPNGRLIGSQVIGGIVWLVMFLLLVAVFAAVMSPIAARNASDGGWLILLGATVGVGAPLVLSTVAIVWAQISKSLRYSIAPTPDGVRITFGLFTTVTETLPPGRIHAVEVSQSILWRPFGWWTVKINRMSGQSVAQQASAQGQMFNTVLPVGTRADVERVLDLVLPDAPAADRPLVWEHGVLGPVPGDPYRTMARRARWRRPLSWRRHGYVVTDHSLLLRRGRIWRKLTLVPLARLQGVGVSQGPVERLQTVGRARAHTVPGPVTATIVGIERDDVVALLDAVSLGAVAAAASDHSHRWGEADVVPPPPYDPPAPVPVAQPRDTDDSALAEQPAAPVMGGEQPPTPAVGGEHAAPGGRRELREQREQRELRERNGPEEER